MISRNFFKKKKKKEEEAKIRNPPSHPIKQKTSRNPQDIMFPPQAPHHTMQAQPPNLKIYSSAYI